MGPRDLQLHKKDRSTGSWILVPIPETFPEVELRTPPGSSGSSSPAPGRPSQERYDKRTRESSGSSTDQNTPKVARKVDHQEENGSEAADQRNGKSLEQMRIARENAWREEIENANLVSDAPIIPENDEDALVHKLDVGKVTSICGTPMKAVSSQDNHTESPVFTNTRRPSLAI